MSGILDGFAKTTVRISDPEKVNRILQDMVTQGKENLQILADFDYTLTKFHLGDQVRCDCSWESVKAPTIVSDEFFRRVNLLVNKYRTHEVNPDLSVERKILYMEELYEQLNNLVEEFEFTEEMLNEIMKITTAKVSLRDGASNFFEKLIENKIPILVISAGFGEAVLRFLQLSGHFRSEEPLVLSNFLDFDPITKKNKGLKKPYIHVFNKNGGTFLRQNSSKLTKEFKKRKNIILMGDSLGDLGMSDGVYDSKEGNLLKIGFLNHDYDELIELYLTKFDIVLVDDQTLDFPNFVLDVILGSSNTD